jgi:2-succinyl-5-enolpyruvyl-6-hydroxy-3-cyclohexene-1-carboxylate synthase
MTQHQLITQTLERLASLGVREVCVAAGARNAPLVAALADSRGVRLWNFFEERSASFFALGRILADRRPVAVVTTSGTAVAELLPAAIEAYYQALPLILVTADRPERFRGSGAPQAIEQEGILGVYARPWPDAGSTAMPVHLNLCLDEPLTPAPGIDFAAFPPAPAKPQVPGPVECTPDVVLAAGLHPDEARQAAPVLAALGAPIVAEATANLHAFRELEPLLVHGGEKALRRLNPARLLRIGAVPSWRFWRDLENRPEVEVTNLCRAAFPGLARRENVITRPLEALACLRPGRGGAGPDCASLTPDFESTPLSEPAWMRHLAAALPPKARVFLGNSLPVREFNLAAGGMLADGTHFYANRGANGIDGLLSTFLGVAAAHEESSWLIAGDLSTLYDLAAPWILHQLPQRAIRFVVINNGGGKIFSRVASLRDLPEPARHIIENRHSLSFRPFAELWGLDYMLAQQPDDLLDLPQLPMVIEIRPDSAQTEAFWQGWS